LHYVRLEFSGKEKNEINIHPTFYNKYTNNIKFVIDKIHKITIC